MLATSTPPVHRLERRSGTCLSVGGRLLASFPRAHPYRAGYWPSNKRSMVRHALLQTGSYADFVWPLALSTAAGLSTSIGGLIAVVRKPSQGTMAGLLGVAMGVMACVSIVELIARNALENDAALVCASALAGGLAYYILEPFFPKVPEDEFNFKKDSGAMPEIASSHMPLLNSLDSDTNTVQRKKARKPAGFGATTATGAVSQQDTEVHVSAVANGGTLRPSWTIEVPRADSVTLPASDSKGVTQVHDPRPEEHSTPQHQAVVPGTADQWQSGTQQSADCVTLVNGGNGGRLEKHESELPGRDSHAVPGDTTHTSGSRGDVSSSRQPGSSDSVAGAGAVVGGQGSGEVSVHTAWLMGGHAHTPHSANLLRLGLLMTITMTLHNMPEGFAVAFSAGTSLGPVMALAIALHNIPEGVIIAAPIYAATNSRWKALGLATLSGLSEPFGALLALLVLHPWITEERLQYMLAFVGGLMLAVCVIELWPEARACRNDRALAVGVVAGAAVMAWTLAVEG